MGKEIKCVMYGDYAKYLTEKTKEPLCEKCAIINEEIQRSNVRR